MENGIVKECIEAFFRDVKLDLDIDKILKDRCDKCIQIGMVNVTVDGNDISLTNIPNPNDDTYDFYNRINYYFNTDNCVQFSNNMSIILRIDENRIEIRFPIGKYLVEYFIFYDELGFSMKVVNNSNNYTFEELVKKFYKCSISRDFIENNEQFIETFDLYDEEFSKVAFQFYQDKEFIKEQQFVFEYLNIYYPNISKYLENTFGIIKDNFIKDNQQQLDNGEEKEKFKLNNKGIKLFLKKIKENRTDLKITVQQLRDEFNDYSFVESMLNGKISVNTFIGLMKALRFTNEEILNTIYNLAGTRDFTKDKSDVNKKIKKK